MEVREYALNASSKTQEIDQPQTLHTLAMLKENAEMPPLVQTVRPKGQEFIDHTLLAPEYLRDSNNFIMDLMDQQVVFQKPAVTSSTETDFAEKEQALHSDLQFQNAIFQFVNKHGQIQCAVSEEGVAIEPSNVADASHSFTNKLPTNFITLNGNFLTDPASTKSFDCNDLSGEDGHNQFPALMNESLATICDLSQQQKQNVSALSLLGDEALNSSSLIPETDLLYSLSNARKVLPHKKRISKKLKDTEANSDYSLPPVEIKEKERAHRMEEQQQVLQFSCEICGHATSSQLDFFAHLKQHYEPEPLLPPLKTAPTAVVAQKMFIDDACLQDKKFGHDAVTQVFEDVHLNFEDFQQVDDSVVHVISEADKNDDMKILNSNSIDKCIQFVAQNGVEPPKLVSTEEIEFSDTEDMLEGIRNVVDKVSIEDTCDAVDMMTSNTIRSPWFSNNGFSGISFGNKLIRNPDFASVVNPELPLPETTPNSHSFAPQEGIPNLMDGENKEGLSNSAVDGGRINLTKVPNGSKTEILTSAKFKLAEVQRSALVKSSAEETNDKPSDAEETKRQYCCTYCPREFNSNNALKYHTRTHTGVRPHQCEICGRSFFAHGALKSHILTHTGDKPFECKICQRKFRQGGDLRYHMTSLHNDVKCHQCEFCGKAFARKYSLVVHRRIHTSECDYKCEFCPKSFRASIYLQNHRKIHTGEKPYQCETCSKKFRVSGDFKRHLRTHERKEAKVEAAKGT